jgi:hypothetical protein
VGKTPTIPPPAGGLLAAVVAVVRRGKEYHVVATVEGHELKTPETEHRPGLERLPETAHLELDGKLFVNTQQVPYLACQLSAFRPRGVPGPTSKLSPRAPAQMGRRETEREGGKKPEGDRRKRGNPRPSCLSRAQVGCACSRGLQASTREGARGLRERRPVLPRAANTL